MRMLGVLMLMAVVISATLAGPARAADDTTKANPEQGKAQARLDAVRARIKRLTTQQQQASEQRGQLAKQLAQQARALRAAADAVHETDRQQAALNDTLAQLRKQQQQLENKLSTQHDALAALLRATYMLGHGSDLRMLLGQLTHCAPPASGTSSATDSGCAPGQQALARIQRALAYSRYFQQDRMTRIKALLQDLSERRQVGVRIAAQQLALADSTREHALGMARLKAERDRQKKLLAATELDMQYRHATLETLRQNQKSLQTLLYNLRDIFADIRNEITDDKPFSSQRGILPWPLSGAVKEQKPGILIVARPGTHVRAVAHGRVAYAAWLRGYGMLLIIDHGDHWMSLYGGNETLLRGVGDWVNRGDVIAASGNGENGENGLYFSLRHSGKAVKPRPWLGKH